MASAPPIPARARAPAAVAVVAIACGAWLTTARGRWAADGERVFEFGLAGARTTWDAARMAEAAAAADGWLRLAAALVAFALGSVVARALVPGGAKRVAFGVVAALAAFAAIDPAVFAFVATRGAAGAPDYLEVEHQAAGLGVLLVALGVARFLPRREATATRRVPRAAWLALACVTAAVVPELRRVHTVGDVALTNDGVAYRFQAELFARGASHQAWTPAHAFFGARQIWPGDEQVPRVFAKYPPGHPAVLAAGMRVGHERAWLWLGALLGPLLVFATARALRLRGDVALVGAWLFALSPAVIAASGSDLAFASSVPFALLALWLAAAARARLADSGRAWQFAVAAGIALGALALIRPGTAVALAAALVAVVAVDAVRARPRAFGRAAREIVLPTALAMLPALFVFFLHNRATTGDPWTSPYALYARALSPDDTWGLANAARAPAVTAFNVARLSSWLLGVGGGALLVVIGAALAPRAARVFLVAPPLALLVFHAFLTFHGVPWAGPVYLVESSGVLALLAATALLHFTKDRALALPLAFLAVLASSALLLHRQGEAATRAAAARTAPQRAAVAAGIDAGIVFVPIRTLEDERRIPLPPPTGPAPLLFARDLGAANRALIDAHGRARAWRFDEGSSTLMPIE